MELRWGWFSKLPALCAACWSRQLSRQMRWGIIGSLQHWEPCLNLRLFHYPRQFSESWRQPGLSHFWKINMQTKTPAQNSQTEKIFQFTGKSKYCATEHLRTAYVAVSGCTFTSGRSLSSVTILIAHRCQSKLDFLTGWTEILEMLEEHLKMLHTFNKIMCE